MSMSLPLPRTYPQGQSSSQSCPINTLQFRLVLIVSTSRGKQGLGELTLVHLPCYQGIMCSGNAGILNVTFKYLLLLVRERKVYELEGVWFLFDCKTIVDQTLEQVRLNSRGNSPLIKKCWLDWNGPQRAKIIIDGSVCVQDWLDSLYKCSC